MKYHKWYFFIALFESIKTAVQYSFAFYEEDSFS